MFTNSFRRTSAPTKKQLIQTAALRAQVQRRFAALEAAHHDAVLGLTEEILAILLANLVEQSETSENDGSGS